MGNACCGHSKIQMGWNRWKNAGRFLVGPYVLYFGFHMLVIWIFLDDGVFSSLEVCYSMFQGPILYLPGVIAMPNAVWEKQQCLMAVSVIKPIGPPTNVFSEGSYFDNAFTFCALFIHFLYYLSLILQAGAEELEINVLGRKHRSLFVYQATLVSVIP